jgi:hypothetical protein
VALALDPYPRKPGITFADMIEDEHASAGKIEERNPFAGLGALRKGKS